MVLLSLLLTLTLTAPNLTVSPNFAPEPATLVLTTRNFSESTVCVELSGDEYYAESCQDREGRSILQFRITNIPAGSYVAQAYTRSRSQLSNTIQVVITKVGPE